MVNQALKQGVSAQALVVVEVTDEPIQQARPYTDKKTGMQKMLAGKQNVYVHQGERYPLGAEVNVDEAVGPLRPGRYLLAGQCFKLGGEYATLRFNDRDMRLVPVEEAIAYFTNKTVEEVQAFTAKAGGLKVAA